MLYCLYRNNDIYIVKCTLLSMVFQASSFMVINGIGIGPQFPSMFVLMIYSLKKIQIHKGLQIKRKIDFLKLFPALFLICIFFSYKINSANYNDNVIILYLIQITLYILCCYCFYNMKVTSKELDKAYIEIVIIVLIVGIVQLLGTTIIPRNFIFKILYTPDTASAYYWGFYPRIFSTFMEPSYCSSFLVASFFYLLSKNTLSIKNITLTILCLIEIMLTFSSTAYATLAIVGVVYIIISKSKKPFRYLIPLGIVALILLFSSGVLLKVLNDVIFEKANSGSGQTRAVWNKYCFQYFCENPIWGAGYKLHRASSFHISILAQLGVIGTAIFAFWILYNIYRLKKMHMKMSDSVIFFMISVLVSMCISIPDIDFLIFWFTIYFAIIKIRNGD